MRATAVSEQAPSEEKSAKHKDGSKKRKRKEHKESEASTSNGTEQNPTASRNGLPETSTKDERRAQKKRKHDLVSKSDVVKTKKRKSSKTSGGLLTPVDEQASPITAGSPAVPATDEVEGEPRTKEKKKKRKHDTEGGSAVPKNKKRKSTKASNGPESLTDVQVLPTEGNESTVIATDQAEGVDLDSQKKVRFIVFVGNLPYTTTTETLSSHFAKIRPDSVRHLTHKSEDGLGTQSTGKSSKHKAPKTKGAALDKSKGFGFLEFTSYDRMRTCLQLYHHSNFDDGKSPARKINVELTAGGGGKKSKDRQEKLKVKNERLNEQRKRKAVEDDKRKRENGVSDTHNQEDGQGEIHPSRRAQMPEG